MSASTRNRSRTTAPSGGGAHPCASAVGVQFSVTVGRCSMFLRPRLQELFDELDVIELFQQPGGAAYYGEITDKQRELYVALGVEPPG